MPAAALTIAVVPLAAAETEVTVAGEVPQEEAAKILSVRLRQSGREEVELSQPLDVHAPRPWTVRFPAVGAGVYELVLEARANSAATPRALGAPVRVAVPAGETVVAATARF